MNALYAVDTDVISFQVKVDSRASFYREKMHDNQLLVSFMTIAELDQWVIRSRWGERLKGHLEEYLSKFTVVHSNRELCLIWAEVTESARVAGFTINAADAWIAATALAYDIPLITHNSKDYRGVSGLQIISAPV